MSSRPFVVCALVILSFMTLSLMTGCATLTQAEIKFLETRELDLPYDEAYQAAANGLFSLGFAIDHSDKESGILSSKRSKKAAKLSVTFLLILPLPTVSEGSNDEAITFLLTRLKPKVTQLRMKVVKNGEPVVDRELMTSIWQSIEREALLDTRPATRKEPREVQAASAEPSE